MTCCAEFSSPGADASARACFIEAFAGSGAVLRRKRPAARNIAIDRDDRAIATLANSGEAISPVEFRTADALAWLDA